ncbi:MAG TPA: cyclic pyranopterin monophosphate synthase MoaC [Xanthomonadales bacterium]|nr:cyclic pyranopterin monophosphate synthase MoaC [Xanthomonadales bacterium]
MATRRRLSHVDAAGRPRMVDVSAKDVTQRSALARCDVVFPRDVADALRRAGLRTKKGAIVDTAVIAGTMAAKRTHELVPFCHPLPLEHCAIAIDFRDARTLRIECTVRATARTGVEMEALTAATVAALTVYDMCKALSHAIEIRAVKLVGKRGGKRDVGRVP